MADVDRIYFSRDHGAFPAQREYVRNILSDSYADSFVGGYGAGKTRSLAYGALIGAALNPGCTSMCVEPTYRMAKDVLWPALVELLDENGIPYIASVSDMQFILPWWDHKVMLRSADKPDRLKGSNLAAGHVDEPGLMAESVWVQVCARVRDPHAKHKIRAATGTPEGLGWFYETFGTGRAGHTIARARTADNLALDPSYVQQLLESMDEQHVRAYLYGEFVPLWQQQVYYNFDRRLHASAAMQYDQMQPLFWSHDFNVNPMCSVVFQAPVIDGRRHVHFLDEIIVPDSNTPEVCREFVRRYGEHRGLVWICGDPAGFARDTRQESARSDYDIIDELLTEGMKFAEVGRFIDRAHPSLRRRHNTTNALLKSASGAVSIAVDPACKGLIASFERTVRKEGTQEVDKKVEWRHGRQTYVGVEHPTDAATYPLCRLFKDPREILRQKEAA